MSKSKIEKYVIERVKDKRIASGFSQAYLADLIDVTPGFIGKAESPKYLTKYNLNHINKLAIIFNCSPQEFLPVKPENENEHKKDNKRV